MPQAQVTPAAARCSALRILCTCQVGDWHLVFLLGHHLLKCRPPSPVFGLDALRIWHRDSIVLAGAICSLCLFFDPSTTKHHMQPMSRALECCTSLPQHRRHMTHLRICMGGLCFRHWRQPAGRTHPLYLLGQRLAQDVFDDGRLRVPEKFTRLGVIGSQ